MRKRRSNKTPAAGPKPPAADENTSPPPPADGLPQLSQPNPPPEPKTKAHLEVEKLRLEIEEKRHASRWVVSAVRNMKLNEWAVGLAAVIALFVAWTTGLFDATRQNLAAQSERLMVQKNDLEQKRETLDAEVEAKEKELEVLKKRLLPFEREETAIQELRQFRKKLLNVRFSTTPEYDGLKISVRGRDAELDNFLLPKTRTNLYLGDALKAVNQVRSLKGLKISELTMTPGDALLATEHSELHTLVIEDGGMETKVLTGLRPLPNLRELVLTSNKITSFHGCPSLPSVGYLDVSENPLDDEGLASLVVSFPNVSGLNLAGTNVSDEGMKTLVKLQGLSHINLRNTRTTGRGALKPLDCPKLMSVDINKEVVTDEQRAVMKQQRPNDSGFLHKEGPYRWGGDW